MSKKIEIICGDIVRDESGKASFVPDPNGQWKMVKETNWVLGIDPHATLNLLKIIKLKVKQIFNMSIVSK